MKWILLAAATVLVLLAAVVAVLVAGYRHFIRQYIERQEQEGAAHGPPDPRGR